MITNTNSSENEAYGLLRAISIYKTLTEAQLVRMYPAKERVVITLLQRFVKQSRIYHNTNEKRYSANETYDKKIDNSMLAAFWVLLDFIDKAEYHSSSDYPVKISFITIENLYEIICVPFGKEKLISHVMAEKSKNLPRRIIIVDNTEQIPNINIPNTSGYCTVNPTGAVQYYKRE